MTSSPPPHPFARVLLATEHSVYDGGAETLALAMARACALPLQAVLPLAGNPEFEAVAPRLAARAEAEAAERRLSLLAMARAQQVALTVQVRQGPEAFESIVRAARELPADLIVIRRRGRHGLLAQLLVGEMVGKVVARAPCSVLVVPRAARLWQRALLVGVAPERPQLAAVVQAATLAAACALPLHVLCVVTAPAQQTQAQAALAAALQRARGLQPQTEGCLRSGAVPEQMAQRAREVGADLLVLGRGARARAWPQGTAMKVVGQADCPVLLHVGPHVGPG